MIARLRDRWDGTFDAEGEDLPSIAKAVYGDDRDLNIRYSADLNAPQRAVITELTQYGELVVATVISTGEAT